MLSLDDLTVDWPAVDGIGKLGALFLQGIRTGEKKEQKRCKQGTVHNYLVGT